MNNKLNEHSQLLGGLVVDFDRIQNKIEEVQQQFNAVGEESDEKLSILKKNLKVALSHVCQV